MGSNLGYSDERPVHTVNISTFQMMKTEVTVGMYRSCVDAGECTQLETVNECNWSVNAGGLEDYPVNCISWYQLNEFAAWAGARLPTEAEWRYAARSEGQNITYPWGNVSPTCAYADFYNGSSYCNGRGTSPVCKAEC